MKLWLVVPVKPLSQGKRRLAHVLTPEARAALVQRLLNHVLATARTSPLLAGTIVVSRDPAVLRLADDLRVSGLAEHGAGLNRGLEQARDLALALGATGLLVLPADLPLLSPADLDTLCDLALAGAQVVIAPSRDGGTNGLLLTPPDCIPFAFGRYSAARHRRLARAGGRTCAVYNSDTLAVDIDRPEDLLAAG
jgi:2-phospho-L-lactate/phosphoenolpyruvate guanylyltransferase